MRYIAIVCLFLQDREIIFVESWQYSDSFGSGGRERERECPQFHCTALVFIQLMKFSTQRAT